MYPHNRHVNTAELQRVLSRVVSARSEPKLKAKSNLTLAADLQLKASQLRTGFIALLGGRLTQTQESVFLGLVLSVLAPELLAPELDIFKARGRRLVNARAVRTLVANLAPNGNLTRMVKKDTYIEVAVPLLMGSTETVSSGLAGLRNFVATPEDEEVDLATLRELDESLVDPHSEVEVLRPVSVRKIISQVAKTADTKQVLTSCLQDVWVEYAGYSVVVFASFRITKPEAQHMANKPWMSIRPLDIYPLIQEWASRDTYFGIIDRAPVQSFSLSTIARTLPTDPAVLTYKVNEHSLACDSRGRPLYIPRECDNTALFEDQLMQAGSTVEGTFTLQPLAPQLPAIKLPTNMPVLVDWVNAKFSYSTTQGSLEVRNLANCRAASSVHVDTWLKHRVQDTGWKNLQNLVEAGTSGLSLRLRESDVGDLPEAVRSTLERAAVNGVSAYLRAASLHLVSAHERSLLWGDLAHNSDVPFLRPVGRYLRDAHTQIMANIDTVYARYSVRFTVTVLPYLILTAVYAPRAGQVAAEAATLNQAAADQHGTPDYEIPELPLWNPDLGFQPHQRRVAELLSGSPDLAIIPIPAGGGKTPVIIADILYNYSKGIGAPYMILCPSHLVAQYVKEINFFTKGKLNAIPIRTQAVRFTGLERLASTIANAPRNTVVVVDYDVVKFRGRSLCYGTTTVNVFPVAELLKQFDFKYCALDESHYTKNEKSVRARSIQALIADIPMKRLASGTMVHDSASDLAMQLSMLDPTLFGSEEDFNEEYGLEHRGGRVTHWKPGYGDAVMKRIRERVVVAGASRREWAALLPPISEAIIPSQLTPQQRSVYDAILEETVEHIRKDSKLMTRMQSQQEGLDETEEDLDLAGMLSPHLARLEQFVSAPDKDPLGDQLLTGDDRVSPKMASINAQIREHLSEGRPGKILIFTNYTATAEHIYENLDPEVKKYTLHYLASNKVEDADRFENDPNTKIMVGVENSMNTGLNLQHASVLHRVETIWNPGTLEQGNSRINRPSFKINDTRDQIYYYWHVCDATIDVTKLSRLTAKIVAVAKFENAGNEAYQKLPDLISMPLTLDTIQTANSWNGTLQEYGRGYREYRQIVLREYAEYKEKFIEKYGDDFMYFPGEADTPPDAMLAAGIPYVEGLEIAGEDELGLIRVDQFLRLDAQEFEDAEGAEDADEDEGTWEEQFRAKLLGQEVHTEFGDGVIVGVAFSRRHLRVQVGNMVYARIRFAAAFLKTKPLSGSVKELQGEIVGLDVLQTTDIPSVQSREVTITQRERRSRERKLRKIEQEQKIQREKELQVTLSFVITNGYLGIRVDRDRESEVAIDALEAAGFRPDVPVARAWMKTAKMLENQLNAWYDKGFDHDDSLEEAIDGINEMYHLLLERKVNQQVMTWKVSQRNQLRNFYRVEMKPSSSQKLLKVYPLLEDQKAYLVLPLRGQTASRKAMQVRAPGAIWRIAPETISWYCQRPAQANAKIRELKKQGLIIRNEEELKEAYSKLRRMKQRKGGVAPYVDVET